MPSHAYAPYSPVTVIGHDDLCVQATRDALTSGNLLNPVRACDDVTDFEDYVLGTAPYLPREEHPLPAVVLTELHLPSGTAMDVLRMVRGNLALRGTPVVVVSTGATDSEIAEITALGATAYLDRGVATEVLVGVLRDSGMPWSLGHRAPAAVTVTGNVVPLARSERLA